MAPKKNKGKGASSSSRQIVEPDYDTTRFPSRWAFERFFHVIATRALIPKRGLAPDQKHYPFVVSKIEGRGWGLFTSHPKEVEVPTVWEFYANINENGLSSFVHGRTMRFNSASINHLFGFPDIYRDNYVSTIDRGLNLDDVILALYGPRVD